MALVGGKMLAKGEGGDERQKAAYNAKKNMEGAVMAYTLQELERMSAAQLDGELAARLDLRGKSGFRRWQSWAWIGERGWAYWDDYEPPQSCTPPEPLKYPEYSSTYEGMSRVMQKMIEKGFSLSISRESEVTFTDIDGKETRYAGDIEWGSSKPLPLIIAIAAIMALEAVDTGSLARWSLRGWLKGRLH
jgi:hypothetical protein